MINWKHRTSVRLVDVRPSDWAMKSFMRFCRRVALTCGSHRIVNIQYVQSSVTKSASLREMLE